MIEKEIIVKAGRRSVALVDFSVTTLCPKVSRQPLLTDRRWGSTLVPHKCSNNGLEVWGMLQEGEMRIASILIPNLSIQAVTQSRPELQGRPVVIYTQPLHKSVVFDAPPEAEASGVTPGISFRKAYSLCPEAVFLPADEAYYREVFGKVLDVLDGFSPAVDVENLGLAYLDVSGVRGELEFAHEVLNAVFSSTHLRASTGITCGKFFSKAAALSSARKLPVILPEGKEKEFIAPFSIDALPCSDETKERLHLFGIRFVGEVSRFPQASLLAQFGAEGGLIYDLSQGIDKSPLIPRKKQDIISDDMELERPAITSQEILGSCAILMAQMLTEVKSRNKLCREVEVRLASYSGEFKTGKLWLKEASASKELLLSRISSWLETVNLTGPILEVGLSLALCGEEGKPQSLFPVKLRVSSGLSSVARQLKERFGYQPLKKIEAAEANAILPERRFRLSDVIYKE